MTESHNPRTGLSILLVEDDAETLEQFREGLPREVEGELVNWTFCGRFDDALQLVALGRFDLIATDIYRDREGVAKENLTDRDQEARAILEELRGRRFTPVVVFSDSALPPGIDVGPFVVFADKTAGNAPLLAAIGTLIKSGVPAATRNLHAAIDTIGGEYLWGFLKDRWTDLRSSALDDPAEIERIMRRRIATAFGRTDPGNEATERSEVDALDFYIYPRISTRELRLGDVAVRRSDGRVAVVLTPHCHLAIQGGSESPRVDTALITWSRPASELLLPSEVKARGAKRDPEIRRKLQSPADLGTPNGRYWFLPPFLDIPAGYCDLIDIGTVAINDLTNPELFGLVGTLDAPFAEALQSCFLRLYAAVGLPTLRLDPLRGLFPEEAVDQG